MKQKYVLGCLLLLAAACRNPSEPVPTTSVEDVTASEKSKSDLLLQGCYATSTQPGKDVAALFDDRADTYWESRAGAGPDEGIMLLLHKPSILSAIQLEVGPGSFEPAGAQIRIYVDGNALPPTAPDQKIELPRQPIDSIYIRFLSTGKEKTTDLVINDAKTEVTTFPKNASIRIDGIRVWDDRQQEVHLITSQQAPGKIVASSTLTPVTAFGPGHLFDSRVDQAWVEGNDATSGENEMLTFQFEQNVRITALQIRNGYQSSDEHFSNNARMRDFSFGAPAGSMNTYTLRDTKAGQKIELSAAVEGKVFQMAVKSTYPGKRYKDLTISEMLFWNDGLSFVLKPYTEQPPAPQHGQLPLDAVLDRRIFNRIDAAYPVVQSLILRSDGSFSIYRFSEELNDRMEAEGNWELRTANAKKGVAMLTLFGKWTSGLNKGKPDQGRTQVFREAVTVTQETVAGDRVIGTFRIGSL